jgi:uncharacterized protein YunC (DUF1805 family)
MKFKNNPCQTNPWHGGEDDYDPRLPMPILTTPIETPSGTAEALEVSWDGGQFVMIIVKYGVLSCGVIDEKVMARFGAAVAIARGTPENPLVTPDDLLAATVADVTEEAAAKGITVGMTGADALAKLSLQSPFPR